MAVGAAGDVNGDGFADVIVGASNYSNGQTFEGRAFVYPGSATGLATSPVWTAEANQTAATFGSSVSTAGDVNGDSYDDVIVGALLLDNGQLDEGRAYAYLGSATGLATSPAWTAEGDQLHVNFGTSVSTAGDVNGDGYDDVIVGAPRFVNGELDEGRAFVYMGSAVGLTTSAIWTTESNQSSASLGFSVSTAGDVNGDGYGDLIVGAGAFSNGQSFEGRAYVFLGASGFVSSTVFSGDGINADSIAPLNAVIGSSWSAPLTIGHAHGASGAVVLKLRTATMNGSNFASPFGGRLTEVLITGPLVGTFAGSHNGVFGNIAPQSVPSNIALVGLPWAAQYTVGGGGFIDLSQAVYGVVVCQ
jgi:hypothetical protein